MGTTTFKDAEQAFEEAIQQGRLSADPKATFYAGRYMYMGTRNGVDLFKNINTREYRAEARARIVCVLQKLDEREALFGTYIPNSSTRLWSYRKMRP